MNPKDLVTDDTAIATTLGKPMHRRSIMKGLAGIGAATLAVKTVGPALANHPEHTYTVSANANFRSGPGTTYSLLGVVTKGATFKINGKVQNGYAGIIYNGKTGWVLASLVVEAPGGGSPPILLPRMIGIGWTSSSVNLRSGPGTDYPVLKVVPYASQVNISDVVPNGYRYVQFNGLGGWMSDAYILSSNPAGQGGSYGKTSANVNLRTQPSTSAPIVQVIPAGSNVQVLNKTPNNSFFNVSYNGKIGWVHQNYLIV